MKHPTLYKKDSKGIIRVWNIWTEGADICTEYGIQDGKQTTSRKTCEGKNIGRANETSPEEQAEFEAKSQWTNKQTRDYATSLEDKFEVPRPMLAKDMQDKDGNLTPPAKKLEYPVLVQPKLDGVRCLATLVTEDIKKHLESIGDESPSVGSPVLLSRQGRRYVNPELEDELEDVFNDNPQLTILDGELYIHGKVLQEIVSLAKKYQDGSERLEYHVYDVITNQEWKTRQGILDQSLYRYDQVLPEPRYCRVLPVGYGHALNFEDIKKLHDEFVEMGYEGAIVRAPKGKYKIGGRSSDLLKVKIFQSDEFTVIDCKEGVGKAKGTPIFVCQLDNGETFDTVMKGDLALRKQLYAERDRYIGRKLTVEYFNFTPDGKPFWPVGAAFRDDLGK